VRSFSLMLKSSSRGAIGSVASSTSAESVELAEEVEDVDRVLRALERRRGRGFDERNSILICCLLLCLVGKSGWLMMVVVTVR
jgi:hypothetical protein